MSEEKAAVQEKADTLAGEVTPAADARLDAALEKALEGRFEEEGPSPLAQYTEGAGAREAIGEAGERVALEGGSEAEEALPAEEEAPADETAEEPAAEEKPEKAGKLERALKALRLDGIPSEVIKTTPQDKLIAWGEKAAKRQAKVGASFAQKANQIRELESKLQETTKSAEPGVPTELLDLSKELDTFAEELSVGKEEARKALKPVLDAAARGIMKAVEAKFAPLEQKVAKTQQDAVARMISGNLARLAKDYPEIEGNEELRDALLTKVDTLARSGGYEDADAVFDDAALLIFKDTPRQRADLKAKRMNGRSAPPERREVRKPQSLDEYHDVVIARSLEGASLDDLKRIPKPRLAR